MEPFMPVGPQAGGLMVKAEMARGIARDYISRIRLRPLHREYDPYATVPVLKFPAGKTLKENDLLIFNSTGCRMEKTAIYRGVLTCPSGCSGNRRSAPPKATASRSRSPATTPSSKKPACC